MNAMTAELCGALHAELAATAADRSTRAIVLTGAGRAFCAGLDLAGYGAVPGNDGSDAARDHPRQLGVSNCDMGTSWLLPRLIGASRAHELMLEDRQQIMALHGAAPQEALSAFLEKRAASFAD